MMTPVLLSLGCAIWMQLIMLSANKCDRGSGCGLLQVHLARCSSMHWAGAMPDWCSLLPLVPVSPILHTSCITVHCLASSAYTCMYTCSIAGLLHFESRLRYA
jgi:hypothetical protein